MNFNSRYYRKFLPLVFIFALFTFVGTAFGQSPEPAKPEMRIQKFESELMKREMPYQVFLPANYFKKKDASYPVVYFLHGYGGLMTYVQKNNQLVSYFARHDLIIVFPEGGNGFYTDSATVENDKYESYIIKELIPEVEKNFRTMADHENRVISGASMGGYGALKFGLKYPEKFSLVGSLAGAIGVTLATEKTFGALGKTVDNIFGPLNSENRKANNLSAIVDKMTPEQVKACR